MESLPFELKVEILVLCPNVTTMFNLARTCRGVWEAFAKQRRYITNRVLCNGPGGDGDGGANLRVAVVAAAVFFLANAPKDSQMPSLKQYLNSPGELLQPGGVSMAVLARACWLFEQARLAANDFILHLRPGLHYRAMGQVRMDFPLDDLHEENPPNASEMARVRRGFLFHALFCEILHIVNAPDDRANIRYAVGLITDKFAMEEITQACHAYRFIQHCIKSEDCRESQESGQKVVAFSSGRYGPDDMPVYHASPAAACDSTPFVFDGDSGPHAVCLWQLLDVMPDWDDDYEYMAHLHWLYGCGIGEDEIIWGQAGWGPAFWSRKRLDQLAEFYHVEIPKYDDCGDSNTRGWEVIH